jgi:hypothetical protein
MSYGKVKETFWTDPKVAAWPDDAKLMALYFLTGPHRNILGCMRVPDGYIISDLLWPSRRVKDAIRILSECHWLYHDDDGWTLISNQLKHDPIRIPNHAKAAVSLAELVPNESPIFQILNEKLTAALDTIGMGYLWHTDAIAIPEPLPEPLPEPEPEPKPEKKESKRVARAPAPKKTAGLPDGWKLDGPGAEYASAHGFNNDQRNQMAADFRGYYTEGDGLTKKRTDLGWSQSWQRWVRNQPNFSSKGKGNGKQPLDHRAVAADLAREIIDRADGADGRAPGDEHHSDATEVENFDVPGDIVTVVDRGGVVVRDSAGFEVGVEVVPNDHGDRAGMPKGGPSELGENPESGSGVDTGGVPADSGGEGEKPQAASGFEVPF